MNIDGLLKDLKTETDRDQSQDISKPLGSYFDVLAFIEKKSVLDGRIKVENSILVEEMINQIALYTAFLKKKIERLNKIQTQLHEETEQVSVTVGKLDDGKTEQVSMTVDSVSNDDESEETEQVSVPFGNYKLDDGKTGQTPMTMDTVSSDDEDDDDDDAYDDAKECGQEQNDPSVKSMSRRYTDEQCAFLMQHQDLDPTEVLTLFNHTFEQQRTVSGIVTKISRLKKSAQSKKK